MGSACKIQGDRARELKLNVKKIHKFQQVCTWILCYKRYEVEVVVWSLTMELDPDPLDQDSTYIGKNWSKFVVALQALWGAVIILVPNSGIILWDVFTLLQWD